MNKFLVPSDFIYDNNVLELVQYNDSYFRLVLMNKRRKKGYELVDKIFNKKDTEFYSQEIDRISLSRTKRNIREICLCNDFSYFATVTVNSNLCDRFSLDECQKKLRQRLENLKIKYKDFKYIFITEKHKNGAFHFHGLISDIEEDFYINENGFKSSKEFDKLGFNSFSKIKNYNACCNYITKYITKDCIRNSHNQIYISSRGLKKALRTDIQNFDFFEDYKNDYCKIKDIDFDTLSMQEKLYYIDKFSLTK